MYGISVLGKLEFLSLGYFPESEVIFNFRSWEVFWKSKGSIHDIVANKAIGIKNSIFVILLACICLSTINI